MLTTLLIFSIIFSGIIVPLLLADHEIQEPLEIPLKIKILKYIAEFNQTNIMFPRNNESMELLSVVTDCSREQLNRELFILENQGYLVRLLEQGKEYYKTKIPKIDPLEFEFLEDISREDESEARFEITQKQRQLSWYDADTEAKYRVISEEYGKTEDGPSGLILSFNDKKHMLKLERLGVDTKGDFYYFVKYSCRKFRKNND